MNTLESLGQVQLQAMAALPSLSENSAISLKLEKPQMKHFWYNSQEGLLTDQGPSIQAASRAWEWGRRTKPAQHRATQDPFSDSRRHLSIPTMAEE